jgi:hypothetical protein
MVILDYMMRILVLVLGIWMRVGEDLSVWGLAAVDKGGRLINCGGFSMGGGG